MTEESSATAPEAGETQELIAIPDATDDDISAFLDGQLKNGNGHKPSEPAEEKEEIAEPTEEPAPAKKEQDEAEEAEPAPKDDAASLKLLQRLEQQEQFIQRRNAEIGDLRKQLKEARTKLADGLEEKFLSEPSEAMEDKLKIREIDSADRALSQEEQGLVTAHQAQVVVAKYIKPGEVNVDDMAECLRMDGIDENYIDEFAKNPFKHALPSEIVHLAKRAKTLTDMRRVLTYAKQLEAEVKKLKGKPAEALKKIERELRNSPQVTAATGGSSSTEGATGLNPNSMTDSDIEMFLKSKK